MPFLLYTYLATEILAPFFASLLILTAILFLGKMAPMLDIILDFGVNFPDFLRFCSYLLPNMFLFIIPMASMIGVIIAFNRMVADNEIIAIKAGGIGLYRMLPPVIMVGLATTGVTALVATTLIPAGNIASKQILFRLAKEKIDNGLKEKQFSENLGNMVIYVDKVDQETRKLHGMYVSDMRSPKTPTTIIAKEGFLAADIDTMEIRLELVDGSMHRAPNDRSQTIFFKKYTLKVPIQEPKTVMGERAGNSFSKGRLTQKELLAKADKFGRETKTGKSLLIEYNKRLAMPIGCFILTLLGMPLAIFTRHGQKPKGLPLGLGLFIIYYATMTGANGFAENNPSYLITPLIWLPNLLFAILTVFFLRQVASEKSGRILDRLFTFIEELLDKLPRRQKKGSKTP